MPPRNRGGADGRDIIDFVVAVAHALGMRRSLCCTLWLLAACASVVPTDEGGTESTSAGSTAGAESGRGQTSGRMSEPGSGGGDRTSAAPTSADPSEGDATSVGPGPGVLDLPIDDEPDGLCLPAALYGPAIETHSSGWTASSGCFDDDLILQTSGAPALLSQDEVSPVYAQYGQSLLGLPGAYEHFTTPCCESPEELCLGVRAEPAAFDVGEALAYLNELFASLPQGCVGVRIVFESP